MMVLRLDLPGRYIDGRRRGFTNPPLSAAVARPLPLSPCTSLSASCAPPHGVAVVVTGRSAVVHAADAAATAFAWLWLRVCRATGAQALTLRVLFAVGTPFSVLSAFAWSVVLVSSPRGFRVRFCPRRKIAATASCRSACWRRSSTFKGAASFACSLACFWTRLRVAGITFCSAVPLP